MDREFKIVSSIFMLFLIFGLQSVYYNGSFVTPIFLNQLVLLFVSVVFFIMNRHELGNWILGVYIFIQLLSCLVDGFTIGFVTSKVGGDFLLDIYKSDWISYVFLICYFAFMFFIVAYTYRIHKLKIVLGIKILLLLATLLFFFIPEFSIVRDVVFLCFLFFYFVSINRIIPNERKVISVMANQFLLIFFLEGLEYLH
jgi:hypothetical protein